MSSWEYIGKTIKQVRDELRSQWGIAPHWGAWRNGSQIIPGYEAVVRVQDKDFIEFRVS
jgi:hypothetical protein